MIAPMDTEKRRDLPQGLWVVATPIGNLGELSERARGALAQADAIYCEDTRRTGALLTAVGISGKSLRRLDAHSGARAVEDAVARLESGESFAYVSDAGTPAISDPGSALVAAARARGVRVTPVAGPSAVAALLSVSGFEGTAFVFRGFFPQIGRAHV